MSELASKAGGLTRQAISNYELNKTNISIKNLKKIAEVLEFPYEYFLKNSRYELNQLNTSPIFFRSSRVDVRVESIYFQKFNQFYKIYKELEKYIDFPKLKLPRLDAKEEAVGLERGYDKGYIDKIAEETRELWGLGKKPINNLYDEMLRNGILISKIETEHKGTDGFSLISGETSMVFINTNRGNCVRDRFSLAHELGHIILHSSLEQEEKYDYKQIEEDANYFASTFLLPDEGFVKDIYSIDISALLEIKKKWKVSLAAIIMRLEYLNIIDENQKRNMFITLSRKGWRKKEPFDDELEKESSTFFEDAIELLVNNDVLEIDELISEFEIGERRVIDLLGLSDEFFQKYNKKPTTPILKLVK